MVEGVHANLRRLPQLLLPRESDGSPGVKTDGITVLAQIRRVLLTDNQAEVAS